MSSKIPTFDKRVTYSTDIFKNSEIQIYVALFISKPELYSDIHILNENDKQNYFFKKFRLFLLKYYQFNIEKDFDLLTYFGDLQLNKKGSVSICGGGDSSRNSKKNALKQFNNSYENTIKSIEYLNQKYKININREVDEREFIGHREIWRNPSPELLKKDEWEWVTYQNYDDINITEPLPKELNKYLIPLNIRNKVYQKWKNSKNTKNISQIDISNLNSDELDEIEFNKTKNNKTKNINTNVNVNLIKEQELIIPLELQQEIDDLFN